MESFMICTGPQYYVFGLMKGDEMEMGIWEFGVGREGKSILVVIE
jgi:hypothetical protein